MKKNHKTKERLIWATTGNACFCDGERHSLESVKSDGDDKMSFGLCDCYKHKDKEKKIKKLFCCPMCERHLESWLRNRPTGKIIEGMCPSCGRDGQNREFDLTLTVEEIDE